MKSLIAQPCLRFQESIKLGDGEEQRAYLAHGLEFAALD
jgi:hypothetical protein